MSDVSSLLGDLYGDNTPAQAPEWSSEEKLEDAFSSWVPGPPDDAPAAERSMMAAAVQEAPVRAQDVIDEWIAQTEPVAAPTVEAAVAPQPTAMQAARWSPSDDDILPVRRSRKKR